MIAVALGCETRAAPQEGGLAGYDLAGAPEWRVTLPDELREISGLATSPDGRVFAHADEEGAIFHIDARTAGSSSTSPLHPPGKSRTSAKRPSRG